MHNVELLPDIGYAPVYAPFLISREGNDAYGSFDFRHLPNDALEVRISALNQDSGERGAREVIAMRSRT